jgi:hypothetical protein
MKCRRLGAVTAALAAASLLGASPALAAKQSEPLLQYTVTGDVAAEDLAKAGFDMVEAQGGAKGLTIVATPSQAAKLAGKGVQVERLQKGRVTTFAAPNPLANPTHGYDVFRPWSLKPAPCPTTCATANIPLSKWYDQRWQSNKETVKKVVYGKSLLEQDLVAYRVTEGANRSADASKPVVIFNATQHAREWIAAETNRRLFDYIVKNKHNPTTGIPQLLKTTELWFVPIVNPDGYDYTFVQPETRMWRKNLRDVNGDGQITAGNDGVDPNRNWPTKWRFDPEGASDNPASETYRGAGPASEPEVKSYRDLLARLNPKFMIDYHSFGELILYPEGWQVETMATDNPLLEALAGHDELNPAIPGYDPDLSAELYTTNGDITDDALDVNGTQAYTVELTPGSGPAVGGTDGSHPNLIPAGFAFQDSEADVQQVFAENRAFALDLAKSAVDPDDATSHIGNTVPDFVPNEFGISHGDPQVVEVNAKKALGAITAHWEVAESGASGSAATSEWEGGLRYGEPGAYFHRMRATIETGATPGQHVKVWFTGGGKTSGSYTYELASDSGDSVLIMAAEDSKGLSFVVGSPSTAPYSPLKYLDEYEAALTTAGVSYDVYDTDATRTAPHPLGVLSHYKAVIWYTGDDLYTRAPSQPGGTGTTLLFDREIVAARDYMNDGGKLLVTGQAALQGAWDQFLYNPLGTTPPKPSCKTNQTTGQNDADDPVGQEDNCIAVSNDFMQYWLGTYLTIGLDRSTVLQAVPPFGTTEFVLDPAGNQRTLHSFLTTSSLLPDYPALNDAEFGGVRATTTGNGPAFDPPEGEWFAATAANSGHYQRLTRTFSVPDLAAGESADLSFKLSHDTEAGYDFVFVEARTAGGDDYVTLPDENGNTTTSTGVGCAEASPYWLNTHPQLRRYITRNDSDPAHITCSPSQPGIWNAATGNSGGFHDWQIDLSAYEGKNVEISIVYQTDPASLGLGAFVDDVHYTAPGVTYAFGFEGGTLGDWTTPPAPPGSAPLVSTWAPSRSLGLVDGPGIATGHSLVWGFGLEGVQDPADRAALLDDALAQFGVTD